MSFVYSGFYLATNIIIPMGYMIHLEFQKLCFMTKNKTENTYDQAQRQSSNYSNAILETNKKNESLLSNSYQCSYGKWAILIFLMIFFSLLNALYPRSIPVVLLGLIIKIIIIYAPQSFTYALEEIIQKCHLQLQLSVLHSKTLELYLEISERINFFMVFYFTNEKEEQLKVLSHMKDINSRMELQLEENQEIKNRSFIVAVKKLKSITKKTKTFQNVGVMCDLMKGSSEIGKQLLKILEEKTLTKQRSQKVNLSKIEQPTKDHFTQESKPQKSAIYPSRSQSLQQKVQKMRIQMKVPTSQKKRINQVNVKDTPFMIKRSQTDIGEELESQQESPKRQRENKHMAWNSNKVEKPTNRNERSISSFSPQLLNEAIYEENSSLNVSNLQDVAALDIVVNDKSQLNRVNALKEQVEFGQNLRRESIQPKILPSELNISPIDQNPIHPFKLNLSNLSNPLILSNTLTTSNILPTSITKSPQNQITSSIKKDRSTSINQPPMIPKKHLSNVSQTTTMIMNPCEQFSEESSIPNKHEVYINESDYSDMFESEDDEEEPKLEMKVEAIFQNQRQNGLKPRLEICYIELYSNDDVRFTSMHDKPFLSGKLIKMFKKPENYYDLLIRQKHDKEQGKKQTEITKKIKFRGQARPFMKFLQKI